MILGGCVRGVFVLVAMVGLGLVIRKMDKGKRMYTYLDSPICPACSRSFERTRVV
jgi:hypothetical protein